MKKSEDIKHIPTIYQIGQSHSIWLVAEHLAGDLQEPLGSHVVFVYKNNMIDFSQEKSIASR